MQEADFKKLMKTVQLQKSEQQTVEVKSAHDGCPEKLYGTLSAFSNQDDGGVILFGLDERQSFREVGVYDPHDLLQRVSAQCKEMEPAVRPLFTTTTLDGMTFVTAEIPPVDLCDRPCFYKGKGRVKGSYVRCGDADEPMSEYEVYSYEAFRKKYKDELRPVERATMKSLDTAGLNLYLAKLKANKPNLAQLDDKDICELMSVTRNGEPTLAATMLFGLYPQAYFPQLCITAVVVPGVQLGELGRYGERFADNKRIEGNLTHMLDEAIQFVRGNMQQKTIVDPSTAMRSDSVDYPITAVREMLLNALVHRDYSIHTEGMPIELLMFSDRMEIRNPGGLYGRLSISELGRLQPDTRNPVVATALETLGITENRYSGIPTILREAKNARLPEPVFRDDRGSFRVTLYKQPLPPANASPPYASISADAFQTLLEFCRIPRTRQELADFLQLHSVSYAIKEHILPLVHAGLICMTIPDRPGSPSQRFVTAENIPAKQ